MIDYEKKFKVIGYSDHTDNNISSMIAQLMVKIEKHITNDKNLKSLDSFSYDLSDLKILLLI